MIKQHISYHLSLSFKFILYKRSIKSPWGSDVLLFSEFINVVSLLFYNFIEFIRLLDSKFSDVLPACARAVGNLWSICLEVNILNSCSFFALHLDPDKKKKISKEINNFFLVNQKNYQYFLLFLFIILIYSLLSLFCLDLI